MNSVPKLSAHGTIFPRPKVFDAAGEQVLSFHRSLQPLCVFGLSCVRVQCPCVCVSQSVLYARRFDMHNQWFQWHWSPESGSNMNFLFYYWFFFSRESSMQHIFFGWKWFLVRLLLTVIECMQCVQSSAHTLNNSWFPCHCMPSTLGSANEKERQNAISRNRMLISVNTLVFAQCTSITS